jgi:S-sulfo-L-cysteine synthase (O-acetyl-L-serine-dependent)
MQLKDIEQRIGRTPLLDLTQPGGLAPILAKVESHNLSGSVKDRPAFNMLYKGIENGHLQPGRRIIEATSGNTGIGLAVIGSLLGFPVTLVIPPQASRERQDILRSAGAEIIFSDPLAGSNGALEKVLSLYKGEPERWFWPNQYYNSANFEAHYETAKEIFEQTEGRVTHFLAATGTAGTVLGTARRLKSLKPTVNVLSIEPAEDFHGIEGTKHMATEAVPEIELDGHRLKGLFAAGKHVLDGTLFISTDEAYEGVNLLAGKGVFAGISSGANYIAALKIAEQNPGSVIVTVLPDGADRYLSEKIWNTSYYGPSMPYSLAREMGSYFEKVYPEEGCGFLLGVSTDSQNKPKIKKFIPVVNQNKDRSNDRYEIAPIDYKRVEGEGKKSGLKIMGIAHSHPDHPPRPSVTDRVDAWEDLSYFIFSIYGGGMISFYSWRLINGDFREELIDISRDS